MFSDPVCFKFPSIKQYFRTITCKNNLYVCKIYILRHRRIDCMAKKAIDLFLVVLDFLIKLRKNQLGNLCFIPIVFQNPYMKSVT